MPAESLDTPPARTAKAVLAVLHGPLDVEALEDLVAPELLALWIESFDLLAGFAHGQRLVDIDVASDNVVHANLAGDLDPSRAYGLLAPPMPTTQVITLQRRPGLRVRRPELDGWRAVGFGEPIAADLLPAPRGGG